jgi:hypothetical protein
MTVIGAKQKPSSLIASFRFAPIPAIRRTTIGRLKST